MDCTKAYASPLLNRAQPRAPGRKPGYETESTVCRGCLSEEHPLAAGLIRMRHHTDLNQLLRVRQPRHADHGGGWPMIPHIFLIEGNTLGEMLLGVCQKDLQLSDVRARDIEPRQHAINVFEGLARLHFKIVIPHKIALHVVGKLT